MEILAMKWRINVTYICAMYATGKNTNVGTILHENITIIGQTDKLKSILTQYKTNSIGQILFWKYEYVELPLVESISINIKIF